MPVTTPRPLRIVLAAAALSALLAGCSSFGYSAARFTGMLSPYKIEVVQGNFISKEQVDALQPGMTRQQVREILGTPLVTSVFHASRWDYVFTLKRQGVDPQQRRLTVFFDGDRLARSEGDTMPSEAEFVTTLDKRSTGRGVPVLTATEEQLRAAATKNASPAPAPAPAAPAPGTATVNYPPLEPAVR
ncbi:outer membrane protein assembly factor BamE [Ramlibacter sp. XY19]|uniref:outer membrane protein assembly factor BamE n=1 Tax=Ramlibacter paludis TaxID=2908000 RepID=UPI0023DBB2B4|nr:outer membrane protein assembly factor BamE [Ramlibacter paludis]MCG2595721.1 outer membrane protein assembly factor BamE [Ramlibacter paludis]